MKKEPKAPSRERLHPLGFPEEAGPTRRGFLSTAGSTAVVLAFAAPGAMSLRSLVPNTLYEKPLRFKAGPLDRFNDGSTFLADQRVYIFREAGVLHCLSAVCTHLGCTVQLAKLGTGEKGKDFEFRCPCHGSRYHFDGTNYAGPAPAPLAAWRLEEAPDDGQLVVDMSKPIERDWRLLLKGRK